MDILISDAGALWSPSGHELPRPPLLGPDALTSIPTSGTRFYVSMHLGASGAILRLGKVPITRALFERLVWLLVVFHVERAIIDYPGEHNEPELLTSQQDIVARLDEIRGAVPGDPLRPDSFRERMALARLDKPYEVPRKFIVPSRKLLTQIRPTIIVANDAIMDRLKREPESIYHLSPRQFEEVMANLLTDMGWQVELTPATRDGGKDILAYLNTDLGRLLFLVEAKKYRKDRKVGVELVRALYGTLCDYQANSAMLVTTSSFSNEARAFQRKHQYLLTLREYDDVVIWLKRYKIR